MYLDPGPELEKDVLNRFSKKMTMDKENRKKNGMIMVRNIHEICDEKIPKLSM